MKIWETVFELTLAKIAPLVIAVKAQQKLAPIAASVRNLKYELSPKTRPSISRTELATIISLERATSPDRNGMDGFGRSGAKATTYFHFPFPLICCMSQGRSFHSKAEKGGRKEKEERKSGAIVISPFPLSPLPLLHISAARIKKGGHVTDLSISVAF